jgi:hypothetical protein
MFPKEVSRSPNVEDESGPVGVTREARQAVLFGTVLLVENCVVYPLPTAIAVESRNYAGCDGNHGESPK